MKEYMENLEGVHIMAGLGDEFTLCGDSFDIAVTEEGHEDGPLVVTKKRIVTCPRCADIIRHCRGVRIAKEDT